MPSARWIEWDDCLWRLSDLAREHHLRPQTLAARIDRGYAIERALATGICSRETAGQRSAAAQGLRR